MIKNPVKTIVNLKLLQLQWQNFKKMKWQHVAFLLKRDLPSVKP